MPRVIYSQRASQDLVRLYQFLAEKNPAAALRAITTIRDSMSSLQSMPKMGRPVENGLREWIIDFSSSGYVALYDLHEITDELVVLAIKHQREDDYA
jgi:plasmid stabilization system protein ParE